MALVYNGKGTFKKWTKEACVDDARKFQSIKDWAAANMSAYALARRRGWLQECVAHMPNGGRNRNPGGHWDIDRCLQEALKYSTAEAFRKGSPAAESAARKHGWWKQCSNHFTALRHYSGYWTLEKCLADAKRFSTRGEWCAASVSAYQASRKAGWSDVCTRHMRRTGNRAWRQLYVFEHSDRSVYVGLSFNPEKRRAQHFLKKGELYQRWIRGDQVFRIVSDWLSKEDAAKQEADLICKYRNEGWRLINKNKGGALGGNPQWSLAQCQRAAMNFPTKKAWRESRPRQGYEAAYKNGWLELCCGHMEELRAPNNFWTFERCQEEARAFDSYAEFRRHCPYVYRKCRENGWLSEITRHLRRDRSPPWTLDACITDAQAHASLKSWTDANASAVQIARRRGWFDRCTAHMVRGRQRCAPNRIAKN